MINEKHTLSLIAEPDSLGWLQIVYVEESWLDETGSLSAMADLKIYAGSESQPMPVLSSSLASTDILPHKRYADQIVSEAMQFLPNDPAAVSCLIDDVFLGLCGALIDQHDYTAIIWYPEPYTDLNISGVSYESYVGGSHAR